MFEHGTVLSNVLANLIEGFDEKDLEKIREELDVLKKERKKAMKKEGEEDEEPEEEE